MRSRIALQVVSIVEAVTKLNPVALPGPVKADNSTEMPVSKRPFPVARLLALKTEPVTTTIPA